MRSLLLGMVLVGCVALPALGYTPPVDRAGPLVVRIAGPETVSAARTPFAIQLENQSDQELRVAVQTGMADKWRVEPSRFEPVTVPAKGKKTLAAAMVAGTPTYTAHYPLHVVARFTYEGQSLEAHPILVFQAQFEHEPQPTYVASWQPFQPQTDSRLALWNLPAWRVVVASNSAKAVTLPIGWQGSDAASRASANLGKQTAGGQTRETLQMHVPYANGRVGAVLAEYPLALPAQTPIRLETAGAMAQGGQSDGVTYRVRVAPLDAPAGTLGEVALEQHIATKDQWTPLVADLGRWAGESIRLQLESHPGPKNNTGWDQSYWAEPTLVVGTPPAPAAFPPTDQAGSVVLGKLDQAGGPYEVRVWPGKRGLLDAVIGFTSGDKRLYCRGFALKVYDSRIDDARSPVLLTAVEPKSDEGGYQVRHRFHSVLGDFSIVTRLYLDRQTLRAEFKLVDAPAPRPWLVCRLQSLAVGPWSSEAEQVYAGHGNVLRRPEAFNLGFDGHRLATSHVGFDFASGVSLVQASDLPPSALVVDPAAKQYALETAYNTTLTFIPSANIWQAVKSYRDSNDRRAAGGVQKLAGRFVFDLWGGKYQPSMELLDKAYRYGLTDSVVVWHNWQRWGYDYRLPDIYPPQPGMGTLEEMQALAAHAQAAGVLFAPHDNYIDFYPDADDFSYDKLIAFRAPNQPQRAWLNEGRQAQSYRYRTDAIEPFVKRNMKLVRDNLKATSYFIDVWSSAPPYDCWSADGKFFDRVATRNVWGAMFAWIRDYLGDNAPQISESGHDQLIGWLDGGQTNHLRVGKPGLGKRGWTIWNIKCDDAERTPWFDAAHHDRFINHGAGYPGRYEGGLGAALHGIYSDDYMATEVLTGHPAMVSQAFSRDVVRKYWLLHDYARALAMRTLEQVEYAGGDLHRQHVGWSGGAEAWVNRGPTDWSVGGAVLPEYGFLARVPTPQGLVQCSIERRDGVIVERASSPNMLYVNGRRVFDGPLSIRMTLKDVKQTGPRTFALALETQADVPTPGDAHWFIHVCDAKGKILAQPNFRQGSLGEGQTGTFRTTATLTVPDTVKPGTSLYVRYGLYSRRDGRRNQLVGRDDGESRICLGDLAVAAANDGLKLTWTPEADIGESILARQNPTGKPIDFGCVVTASGCRLTTADSALIVTPLPQKEGPAFAATLVWKALPWKLAAPSRIEQLDADGKVVNTQPIQGDTVELSGNTDVFCFRIK